MSQVILAQGGLERLLDLNTPRLVAQTLFESIRLTDFCLIDWTNLRPNVMFEAGVRMATNPLGAVHIVERTNDGDPMFPDDAPGHVTAMMNLFDPIFYCCRAGDTEAFIEMIKRFEKSLADNLEGQFSFTYRAIGQALDLEGRPVTLPLVDELVRSANILASDDQESTGISPILYHEINKNLVVEAQEAAADRRLAAWLFMDKCFSAGEIASDSKRSQQFRLLSAQVRRWAREKGRIDLIDLIKSKSQEVQKAMESDNP